MNVNFLKPKDVARIKKLLGDYEGGKFNPPPTPTARDAGGPIETYIGRITSEVSAIDGTTPGDGIALIYTLDTDGDLDAGTYPINVYQFGTDTIAVDEYVNLIREPISGTYWIVKGGAGTSVYKGEAIDQIDVDDTGMVATLTISECGNSSGSSPPTVTVCNYKGKTIWEESVLTYYAAGGEYHAIASNSAYRLIAEATEESNAGNSYAEFNVNNVVAQDGFYPETTIDDVQNDFDLSINYGDKVVLSWEQSSESWIVLWVKPPQPAYAKHGYTTEVITGRVGDTWGQGSVNVFEVSLISSTAIEAEQTPSVIEVWRNKSVNEIASGSSVVAVPTPDTNGILVDLIIYKDCEGDS
ncbi:hypothetical protein [Aeoliella sp.]|uniref:hypothetical protein n=1 Tax=Aeoliella sp. TaxID=2795800 RepID=UPI003CCB9219